MRAAVFAVCTLFLACDQNPPLIGATDAARDTGGSDAASGDAGDLGDAGDAGTSADSSGPCTLSSPPASSTCATCVGATCCTSWNACVANSDCTGYVACVRLCYPDAGADAGPPNPDAGFDGGGEGSGFACAKACEKQYPNGINDGIVVVDCEDNGCAGKCP